MKTRLNCIQNNSEGRHDVILSKKRQVLFSWAFVTIAVLSVFTFFSGGNYFGDSIKRVVASWQPSENIGKLKYVSTDLTNSVEVTELFDIDYCLPFENATLSEGENGRIIVNGNGEIVVRACYKSKVSDIGTIETKRTVTLDCGFGVKVVYYHLDNVGVVVKNKVNKGDSIGVANNSVIEIGFTFRNKPYTKVKVENGKLSLF